MHDELVESHTGAAVSDNSGSSAFSELESGNSELGHNVESLVVGDSGYCNNSSVPKLRKHASQQCHGREGTYCFFPRCLIILVSESGGLLTLDETSLRRTVLQNLASVLLERNLKSYTEEKIKLNVSRLGVTYLDKKMLIKILAPRVFLALVFNSTSFNQIDSL